MKIFEKLILLILLSLLTANLHAGVNFGIISAAKNQVKALKEKIPPTPVPTPINHAPIILSLLANQQWVLTGGSTTITCTASDQDNDSLIYTWEATGGTITGNGTTVIWTSPVTASEFIITCTTRDSKGGSTQQSIPMDTHNVGTLKWAFEADADIFTSAIIGADGTVYMGSRAGTIYALTDTGTDVIKKWEYKTNTTITNYFVMGQDGTIYLCTDNGKLYAVTDKGSICEKKWEYSTNISIINAPSIGPDGTIYVTTNSNSIFAFTDQGTTVHKKWDFRLESNGYSSITIGINSTIYVGTDNGKIIALNDNGENASVKWSFSIGGAIDAAPVISHDGTIYIGATRKLYALQDTGTGFNEKWEIGIKGFTEASPAIGNNGEIYICNYDYHLVGSTYVLEGRLNAIQDDGMSAHEKWSYLINEYWLWASPSIASDGTVYFGSNDKRVYAMTDNGTTVIKKWEYVTNGSVVCTPCIGNDGTIYIGSGDKKLYALYGAGSSATSPWPKYQHDNQNTGRKQ